MRGTDGNAIPEDEEQQPAAVVRPEDLGWDDSLYDDEPAASAETPAASAARGGDATAGAPAGTADADGTGDGPADTAPAADGPAALPAGSGGGATGG
ncbi:hypothetical protein HCN52_20790, partial [Streptomyces bohaiensis]|nr:hypothetical protein [Streptomyces bohaiensis]